MIERHSASYRDPSGFMFTHGGELYRQVNKVFRGDYDQFISSGAYENFIKERLLVPHEELHENLTGDEDWSLTLKPALVPFISYPYEWSFDMLRDAALLTLKLARLSLDHGLVLKDASPYNVQWYKGKLVFIDTLSFMRYDGTSPWVAYRQFCECFASPLLLMHYSRQPLQQLMIAYPEGIPLKITSSLLPFRAKLSLPVYLHIFLHARLTSSRKGTARQSETGFSVTRFRNILDSLEGMIKGLELKPSKTAWIDYYDEASTRDQYLEEKKRVVSNWLSQSVGVRTVADLGANEGLFSRIAAESGKEVLAADLDPLCINRLYLQLRDQDQTLIQPLITDLTQPSPAGGFDEGDRSSFITRCQPDLVLALALIHHLCIGHNIPASTCARFFKKLSAWLILEFVPPDDEKVNGMISRKKISYPSYNRSAVLSSFELYYDLREVHAIGSTGTSTASSPRELWLMQRKQPA